MKILHITAMKPLSPNSGIPVVLHELANYQNEIDGIQARVMSLCSEVTDINSSFFDYVPLNAVKEYILDYMPDLAIFHSFFHYEYSYVVNFLIKLGVKFYVEPHGSFGHDAMKKGAVKKVIANATIFRRQIKKAYGYIFTNCQEQHDSIFKTNHDLIIPNGVDRNIIREVSEKKQESYSNPIFYYLGRYDVHHKGLDYLFDALDILEQKKIEIVVNFYGTGNETQLEYVNERIGRLSIVKATNCGTIYGKEKKIALESSNILLLTSRYEGSPMTILDGFSFGNPCIVTPGTNVSKEVCDNNLGWNVELNASDIAEGIIRANNAYQEEGYAYYTRCKQYVEEHYTWDYIAVDAVEKLINNK